MQPSKKILFDLQKRGDVNGVTDASWELGVESLFVSQWQCIVIS